MSFAPGNLVTARGREWVVLPESTDDFLILRPLGGADDDVAGVLVSEGIEPATFPPPDPTDLGDHLSASMLRSAIRIGFRSTAGPFRCMASIAVEPRSYQLVPLMMALRQEVVRILIADDVGIGKTIEAGLIAKELVETGQARGLSVLCSPALAEQWQRELSTKFGIDAELVLPGTVRRLERGVVGSESIFERYPFTVVSADFIKSTRRRHEYIRTCPDLVIVDEVHNYVAEAGQGSTGKTQRYELVRELSADDRRHLVLASATPHSGKEDAFRNLLGLLDVELATIDFDERRDRERLARHFVQRRRADIRKYLDEETPFPKDRLTKEVPYSLSPAYHELFTQVIDYARETVKSAEGGLSQRISWWSALALLRAMASSPRAAVQTLRTRAASAGADTVGEADTLGKALVLDNLDSEAGEPQDAAPGAVPDDARDSARVRKLKAFLAAASTLEGDQDAKVKALVKTVKGLLNDECNTIVFCRFIDTAEYVAEHLAAALPRGVAVASVTGALPPEERVARIDELAASARSRVLVATDCLSEGVNLQESFQAVVHYDLAWNPTRHEQREGRVDRFGQKAQQVRAVTLYGKDNQIDGIVLEILLRKHEAIRKATGVSVPVPDNNSAVIDALMEGLLLRNQEPEQLSLDLPVRAKQESLYQEWESAAERERESQTKYAQNAIKPEEVAEEVAATRASMGTQADVAEFTESALRALRSTVTPGGESDGTAFRATTNTLPLMLREALPIGHPEPLQFTADLTPQKGTASLTRTNSSVEAIADYVLESALDGGGDPAERPARRCAVIRTNAVALRTTLLLVRYRFRLDLPSRTGTRELIAEDIALLSFRGAPDKAQWLTKDEVSQLLNASPSGNVEAPQAKQLIEAAIGGLAAVAKHVVEHGNALQDELLASHRRVRQAASEIVRGLKVSVEPKPDVLGVFVFVPPAGGR